MKKAITTLLLSLVTVMCLTAVAWATGAPPAPTEDDIIALAKGKVQVSCEELKVSGDTTKGTRHGSQTYDLAAGTFSTEGSTVKRPDDIVNGKYTYTFQFTNADPYIYKFQQDTKYAHINASYFTEVTLEYDGNLRGWQLENNGIIEIKVRSCSTIAMPDAPTPSEIASEGKVNVFCDKEYVKHTEQFFSLAAGTYYTDETSMQWQVDYNNNGAWHYYVFLNADSFSYYVDQFNKINGKHLADYASGILTFIYDSTSGWHLKKDDDGYLYAAYIRAICAPTAAELADLFGLNVKVQCKNGTHAYKTYDKANLLADTSLNFQPEFKLSYPGFPFEGHYQYKVSLTDTAANGYAANYSTAVGKTHTWDKVRDSVTMYWSANDNGDASNYSIDPDNRDSAAIAVYSDPANDPPEVDPDNPNHKWKLTDPTKNTLTVNATCDTTTTPGGTGGGSSTKKTETATVKSATTFDAGIALYAGLGILSITGSAVVIRKKKEF